MVITIPVDLIKKLAAQFGSQLEQEFRQSSNENKLAGEEFEKILHVLLQSALARLDLVGRSEFDAQCQVLSRTRTRLEAAEKKLLLHAQ